MLVRSLARARQLARLSRRSYSANRFDKEVASIVESSWKSGLAGSRTARQKFANATRNDFFAVDTNSHQPCALPCFIPRNSGMHTALIEQPVSRRGVLFNPWTLLLELLDDPRVVYNGGSEAGRILLSAIMWMGYVTPSNIDTKRTELARAIMDTQCIGFDPLLSTQYECSDNVELRPAQLMQLCQIQWPRFIAEKYRNLKSVPLVISRGDQRMVNAWDRAWAATNLCAAQLEKSVVRSRALFNCRFDLAAQSRLSIREGVEHAPGIVMNTILGWTGDLSHIISPAIEERICTQYFANIDTLRSTVAAAWQLYDWLIHNNPHRETPLVLKRHFSLYKSRLATQMAENSSLSLMYRGLCAFDNLKEAQESLYRLNNVAINSPNSTGVRELDRKLVERLMYVKNI
ncbi:hypothetical protein LPJ77_002307 [Coemansia sp. RSA 2523]|nr:hypothetical protein LPJ77_002307 [Coemansia sp. RSA 2523]